MSNIKEHPSELHQLEVIRRYVDAWNRHDGPGVAATFLPEGRYRDPNVPGGIADTALVAYVDALAAAFPDLRFEDVSTVRVSDGLGVFRWVMRGTNTGPIFGRPPTGGTIALPGVDLIRVENGAIADVDGFFDRRTLVEQLGLQVVLNPPAVHPVAFGSSSHVEAETSATPGALSLTMIEVRGEEELVRVRVGTARIAPGLRRLPGFLGFLGGAVGRRLYTVTAWERPEHSQQIRTDPGHAAMVREVFSGNLGVAMNTSTWVPYHLGKFWVRCPECQQLQDIRSEVRCSCGADLKNIPAFW